MRAVAMICVILAHSGYSLIGGMRYGIIAVESFFIISGFLIGGILIRDFQNGVNFSTVTHFWKKRWFRTLPLYYSVLLLKFIFIDHSIGANIFYYLFFLQNNFYGIQYLDVSWTLVVEEWFYILIPFFFIVFFKNGITPKKFYILIALFVIADTLLRYVWVLKTNYGYGAMAGNIVFRMDSNIIGVGLAGIKAFHPNVFKKMANIKFFVFGMLAIIITFILFSIDGGGTRDVAEQALWVRTLWFSLIGVLIAIIIPFFYYSPLFASKEGKQPFRWFITWVSLLSYPIYLVHTEIYHVMAPYFNVTDSFSRLVFVIISNIVVLILSLILYHAIDKPVLNFRAKFLKKN